MTTRPALLRWGLPAVLALVGTQSAHADSPLYAERGGLYLDRSLEDPELMTTWVGVDSSGYVYAQRPNEHLTCWHPDDPLGTRVTTQFSSVSVGGFFNGPVYWAMGSGLDGIEMLGVADGSFGATVWRRGHFRCGDYQGEANEAEPWRNHTALGGAITLENTPRPAFLTARPAPVFAPDGAACWAEPEGVSCVTVDPDGVRIERRFLLSEIIAERVIDPSWRGVRGPDDGTPLERWQLRLPTWLADGRFVVIAELGFESGQRSWGPFPFLMELEEAASPRWIERVRPATPPLYGEGLQVNALAGVNLLTRLDGLEAIVGWRGPEAWVLPDAGGGPFLLDWSGPIREVFVCPVGDDFDRAIACPGSGLGGGVATESQAAEHLLAQVQAAVPVPSGLALPLVGLAAGGDGALVRTLSVLRVVEGELDLDGDGLDRQTERALSTSDTTRRSDGGCLADGLEVENGLDPSRASDDPVRATRVDYRAESRLVEWFLDDMMRTSTPTVPGWAPQGGVGPLCWAEACFSNGPGGGPRAPLVCETKSGVELALGTFCQGHDDTVNGRWQAPDGSFEVQLRGRSLVIVDVETGTLTPLLDLDTADFGVPILPPMAPGQGWAPTLTVVPVDRDRVFIAHEGFVIDGEYRGSDLRVWLTDGAGLLRKVYDHLATLCEAGLGPCAPPPNQAAFRFVRPSFPRTRVAGWLPGAERLVVAVGPEDGSFTFEQPRHLVGLHAERPPTLIGYDFALPDFDELPHYLQATGAGDFLHGYGFMDTCGEPVGLGFEGPGPLVSRPTTILPGYRGIPESGTGVTFYGDINLQGQFFESVPYRLTEAEPGDIFTLRRMSSGPTDWMLMRSGPRGGLAPAWFTIVDDENLRWPSGLDIDADGYACLTDRELGGIGRLHLLGPGTTRTPNEFLVTWDLPEGAADCMMEPDGSILVLQDRVRRLVRLGHPFAEPELVRELTETEPTTLVRAPDGAIEVLDRQRAEYGRLYLEDGRKLEVVGDANTILLDGVPLAVGADVFPASPDSRPWRVELAVRPDGRLVIQRLDTTHLDNQDIGFGPATPPMVYDLEREQALPLTTNELHAHWLIARLPGGEPRDPWTGEEFVPLLSEPLPTAPDTPAPPTGGAPLEGPTDGGCSGGAVGGLVGLLLITRRRAPRAAHTRGRASPHTRSPRHRPHPHTRSSRSAARAASGRRHTRGAPRRRPGARSRGPCPRRAPRRPGRGRR